MLQEPTPTHQQESPLGTQLGSQAKLELHHLHSNVLRRTAWLLGALGLIPFVALTIGYLVMGQDAPGWLLKALLLYAVCIISFLGGIHWGIALVFQDLPVVYVVASLVWSVLPALFAWPLVLLPITQGLLWGAMGLLVILTVDLRLNKHYPVPGWFASLRTILTAVASLSLFVAWIWLEQAST